MRVARRLRIHVFRREQADLGVDLPDFAICVSMEELRQLTKHAVTTLRGREMKFSNMLPDVKDSSAVGRLFDGLDRRMVRWLDCEQTINERLINDVFAPVHHHNNTVKPTLRPEGRPVWDQEVVWLPRKLWRLYPASRSGSSLLASRRVSR